MGVTATKPMLRASSVRDCSRKAVFEATGAPHRERSEREEKTLFRGKSIGRDFLLMFAATNKLKIRVDSGPNHWVPTEMLAHGYETPGLIAEKKITWGYGIGHADGFVIETGSVIEVLSSLHASEAMLHSKMLQCVLYMEHDPDAQSGAVVVVSPTDLSEDIYPIVKSSKAYPGLVDEMRERVAQVQAWAEHGRVPARVCAKPSEARSHFCLYAEHCFTDWTAPPLDLIQDEEAISLASRFYDVKQRERGIKEQLGSVESERKEIEQRLLDIVPPGKHQVGHLELTRTQINRGPSVDLKKASLAGYPVDALSEYMKPGASYSTFRVDRIVAEDFGSSPF